MPVAPHPHFDRFLRIAKAKLKEAEGWAGMAFRSSSPAYATRADLLTGAGSKLFGGRWNAPGSFAAVYLSLSWDAATAEAVAHQRHFGIPEHAALPRVFVAVRLDLVRVLDFREGRLRQRLRVSRKRMLGGDWRKSNDLGEEAVTQALGRAAVEAGFEAILVDSAAARAGANIVVFPESLSAESTLEAVDLGDAST